MHDLSPTIEAVLRQASTSPDEERARVHEIKVALRYDEALADRFVDNNAFRRIPNRALRQTIHQAVLDLVKQTINPEIITVILDPDPGATVNEAVGSGQCVENLTSPHPCDKLYSKTKKLIRRVYLETRTLPAKKFIRRRTKNCLVAIRSGQKACHSKVL